MRPLPTALLLAALVAGCAEETGGPFVEIHDRTYAPDALTVPNGTAVAYRNVDDEEHTVTVVGASATSTVLDDLSVRAGDAISYTFAEPGQFTVYCRFHGDPASGQRMSVTVT